MFYKLLDANLCDGEIQFGEGLFSNDWFSFTTRKHISNFTELYGYAFIADVTFPEDAKVFENNKTDKITLSNIRSLEDFVSSELSEYEVQNIINVNGRALRFIREQTEKLCELAVREDGRALQYVKEQTPYLCELAVKENGMALADVKEQTPHICELAVRQNGWALYFVKEQTPYLCELAVRQNGMALAGVKEQTPFLCELAVKENGDAIQFVREKKTD